MEKVFFLQGGGSIVVVVVVKNFPVSPWLLAVDFCLLFGTVL